MFTNYQTFRLLIFDFWQEKHVLPTPFYPRSKLSSWFQSSRYIQKYLYNGVCTKILFFFWYKSQRFACFVRLHVHTFVKLVCDTYSKVCSKYQCHVNIINGNVVSSRNACGTRCMFAEHWSSSTSLSTLKQFCGSTLRHSCFSSNRLHHVKYIYPPQPYAYPC